MSLTLYEIYELTDGSIDLRSLWPSSSKDRKKFDAEVLAKQFLMSIYIAEKYKGFKSL